MENRALCLTVSNQKGGVGKTTTTLNLAAALVETDKRVLVVDSDPQANLSSYLGVVDGDYNSQKIPTLDEFYLAKCPPAAKDWITKTEEGIDLIASDRGLAGVEYYLFSRADRELLLMKFLEPLRAQYDFILIDTPPSLNLLTLNALVASDRVIIPIQAEFFSLEGIVKLRKILDDVRERWNPGLQILGILPSQITMRRKLTSQVIELVEAEFSGLVLKTSIRDSVALAEAPGHARSVLKYERAGGNASEDFRALAKEIMERAAR